MPGHFERKATLRCATWAAALLLAFAAARGAAGAGRPCGSCFVPAEARAVDTSNPDHVIGTGTPASCTPAAVVSTIALGGIIKFNCGPAPVTIFLSQTAKIYNNTGPVIVIDGGGLVTLDGGGARRILYMNTCDPDLVWTTDHCDNQDHPRLTLQNLTFAHGNSTGASPDGGGAVFARGGRLKVINSRFQDNVCDPLGPDVGGAALRAFDQYNDLPLYVVRSTFGGAGHGNSCSNGGALSSIGVSYTVLNSVISHNLAVGYGANPPQPPDPGGGSGGAIYNDGNTFHLRVCGSSIHDNHANEGGGGIFFVSNNLTGTLTVEDSYIWNCPSDGFWTAPWPWLFYLGMGDPQITGTTFDVAPPDLFCDGFDSQGFQAWSSSSP